MARRTLDEALRATVAPRARRRGRWSIEVTHGFVVGRLQSGAPPAAARSRCPTFSLPSLAAAGVLGGPALRRSWSQCLDIQKEMGFDCVRAFAQLMAIGLAIHLILRRTVHVRVLMVAAMLGFAAAASARLARPLHGTLRLPVVTSRRFHTSHTGLMATLVPSPAPEGLFTAQARPRRLENGAWLPPLYCRRLLGQSGALVAVTGTIATVTYCALRAGCGLEFRVSLKVWGCSGDDELAFGVRTELRVPCADVDAG